MATNIGSFEQLPNSIATAEAPITPKDTSRINIRGAAVAALCALAICGGLEAISLATNSSNKPPVQYEHTDIIPFSASGDFYPPLGSNQPK